MTKKKSKDTKNGETTTKKNYNTKNKTAPLTIAVHKLAACFKRKSMRQPQIHDVIAYLHYLQYVNGTKKNRIYIWKYK